MSNTYFEFKKFTIYQDKCAMKVGTDGVLLGAWAVTGDARQVLDVGTGTGLIALQIAQQCPATSITAIEIDAAAARQATENVNRTPWRERIKVVCCDFGQYQTSCKFDLIVSNPPYFTDALPCPDKQRKTARHAGSLNYESLFAQSARMLTADGRVAVIVPAEAGKTVTDTAWKYGLFPTKLTQVYTKTGKPCRRLLYAFGLHEAECEENVLYIENERGEYTQEYVELTRDYYLKL